jgi:hypothetical protein
MNNFSLWSYPFIGCMLSFFCHRRNHFSELGNVKNFLLLFFLVTTVFHCVMIYIIICCYAIIFCYHLLPFLFLAENVMKSKKCSIQDG